MNYVVGAVIGAGLAVLLGIPAFTTDRDTQSEPPLFSTYCDLEQTAWEGECVPSGTGITLVVLIGAGVGALGAAAFRSRTSESNTSDTQTPSTKRIRSSDIDSLVQEAAHDLAKKIDEREDKSIPSRDVYYLIDERLRDGARRLGVGDLTERTLNAAVVNGTLRRTFVGNPQVLRTSKSLDPLISPEGRSEAQQSTESAARAAMLRVQTRDDVILAAAMEISAGVERKRDAAARENMGVDGPEGADDQSIKRKMAAI